MDHIKKLNQNRTDDLQSLTALAIIASVVLVVSMLVQWFGYWITVGRGSNWAPLHQYYTAIMAKCPDY